MTVAEGRERPEGARGRSQRGDSEVERPVKRPVPGWILTKYVGYASYTPRFPPEDHNSRMLDSGLLLIVVVVLAAVILSWKNAERLAGRGRLVCVYRSLFAFGAGAFSWWLYVGDHGLLHLIVQMKAGEVMAAYPDVVVAALAWFIDLGALFAILASLLLAILYALSAILGRDVGTPLLWSVLPFLRESAEAPDSAWEASLDGVPPPGLWKSLLFVAGGVAVLFVLFEFVLPAAFELFRHEGLYIDNSRLFAARYPDEWVVDVKDTRPGFMQLETRKSGGPGGPYFDASVYAGPKKIRLGPSERNEETETRLAFRVLECDPGSGFVDRGDTEFVVRDTGVMKFPEMRSEWRRWRFQVGETRYRIFMQGRPPGVFETSDREIQRFLDNVVIVKNPDGCPEQDVRSAL